MRRERLSPPIFIPESEDLSAGKSASSALLAFVDPRHESGWLWPVSELGELPQQILLERTPRQAGSRCQLVANLLGNVTNGDGRHDCSVQGLHAECNRSVTLAQVVETGIAYRTDTVAEGGRSPSVSPSSVARPCADLPPASTT